MWRERVPFQLALGDHQGGVRGYSASRATGSVRTVASIEHRWAMGRITRHGVLGLAMFADAGRVWAEDIDEAAVIEARQAAERMLADRVAGFEFSVAAARLAEAMQSAGRDPAQLETSGLVFPIFEDSSSCADLARSIEASVPALIAAGVDSITIKPSQFIDDPAQMPAFLRETDRRVAALV